MLTELWYDLKLQKAELAGREKAFEATEQAVREKERQLKTREDAVEMEKKHALAIHADTKSMVSK